MWNNFWRNFQGPNNFHTKFTKTILSFIEIYSENIIKKKQQIWVIRKLKKPYSDCHKHRKINFILWRYRWNENTFIKLTWSKIVRWKLNDSAKDFLMRIMTLTRIISTKYDYWGKTEGWGLFTGRDKG